jgi:hypothetical protein
MVWMGGGQNWFRIASNNEFGISGVKTSSSAIIELVNK